MNLIERNSDVLQRRHGLIDTEFLSKLLSIELGREIQQTTRIMDGLGSVCFEMSTKNARYFVKCRIFSDHQPLCRELLFCFLAPKIGICAPKVIKADCSRTVFSYEYGIFEYLEIETARLIWLQMTRECKQTFARRVAAEVAKLHQASIEVSGFGRIAEQAIGSSYQLRFKGEDRTLGSFLGTYLPKSIDCRLDYIELLLSYGAQFNNSVICHGDLNLRNILYSKFPHELYLIDSNLSICFRELDLADLVASIFITENLDTKSAYLAIVRMVVDAYIKECNCKINTDVLAILVNVAAFRKMETALKLGRDDAFGYECLFKIASDGW